MKYSIPAALAIAALATSAHAGEMKSEKAYKMTAPATTATTATMDTTTVVSTRTLDGATITAVPNEQYAVLGVETRNGESLYRVADENGEVFLNFVPSELVDVSTDIDEVDTYTYEYRGVTFTNRVVADRDPIG